LNTSFIKKIGAIALPMVFFLFFAAFPAGALTPTEVAKLVASDGAAGDYFGHSVAVDGDTAVIGAYSDDYNGSNSGSAYVFIRSGSSWVQQARLTAPGWAENDFFGYSVAVSGDTAVIGALYDDDRGPNSGAAYVFIRSGGSWVRQAKLTASDGAANDFLGLSVAVSGDTAVIGADGDDDNGSDSGSAYVFIRSGSTWVQQAKLTASDGASSDFFGYSVAVDGSTTVIGAYGDSDNGANSGAAYVFIRSGSSWMQQARLTATGGAAYHYFGYSVAVDGDTAVIGAFGDGDNGSKSGSAYVFIRNGNSWVEQAKLTASDGADNDYFGNSVAVDGDTAVIGADGDDDYGSNSGSAYVFGRSGNNWVQEAKLTAPDGTSGDYFGNSVAVDSGTAAVIGVRCDDDNGTNSGSAYVFVFNLTPPDSDGDGIPDDQDNYPDIPNPDQTDPGSDTPGGGCDVNIDAATVVGAIELKCEESAGILTQANPPGVKGMISKLTGNGSVAAKVADAVYDYADCNIDANTYIDKLNAALNQLDAYDAQVEAKIDSGKIKGNDASLLKGYSDDASLLEAYSDNMRITINNLIGDAMP
jgi:hypothetical protein